MHCGDWAKGSHCYFVVYKMCKELRALVGQFESILTPDDRVPMFFLLSSERPFPQREVEKWRESGNDAELHKVLVCRTFH